MSTKSSMKRPTTLLPVTFTGLDAFFNPDGQLVINIPMETIDRPSLPLLSEEIMQWSREEEILESNFSKAYEAAQDAFFNSLEQSAALEYLIEHSNLSKN